jgi:hypothetical protein
MPLRLPQRTIVINRPRTPIKRSNPEGPPMSFERSEPNQAEDRFQAPMQDATASRLAALLNTLSRRNRSIAGAVSTGPERSWRS